MAGPGWLDWPYGWLTKKEGKEDAPVHTQIKAVCRTELMLIFAESSDFCLAALLAGWWMMRTESSHSARQAQKRKAMNVTMTRQRNAL